MGDGTAGQAARPESYAAECAIRTLTGYVEIVETESPEDLNRRLGSEVDSRVKAVLLVCPRSRSNKVVEDLRVGGRRKKSKDVGCLLRDIGNRNLIVREWSTARAVCPSRRVEDLSSCDPYRWVTALLLTQILAQIAKTGRIVLGIASTLNKRGRNRQLVGRTVVFARRLVIAKEKQLVLDDWAANGATELLPAIGGNEFPGNRIRSIFGERVAGGSGIGSPKPESLPVEVIAAGLRLHCYDSAQRFAELSVIVLQIDLCFLNGVQIRIDDNNSKNRILVVSSIQFECRTAEVLSVHKDLLAALRILGRSMAPTHHLLRPGRQKFKRCEVPIHDRKVFHVLFVELDGNVGAVGFQLLRLCRDLHLLTGRADLELPVHRRTCVGRNLDIFKLKNFEATPLDPHGIQIGNQVRDRIVAALICSRRFRSALGLTDDGYLRAADGGA